MSKKNVVTLKIEKAIALAKKGAKIYRATNRSPFGLTYLSKLKDRSREMKLIVIK